MPAEEFRHRRACLVFLWCTTFITPWLKQHRSVRFVIESATFAVIFPLVFIFLRPINQFIYFQF